MVKYNYYYQLSDSEGSPNKTTNKIIIAHDTGNDNNTNKDSAKNEASFMKSNWNGQRTGSPAYTHAIASWDCVYIIGEPGYVAWGAGPSANNISPFQIELSHYSSADLANRAYHNYVNAIREQAQKFNIPLTLDSSAESGIKSHKWCSNKYKESDHSDPYDYLKSIGITKKQFEKDLINGFSNNPNVVTVNYTPGYGVNSYNLQGLQNLGTNKKLKTGTKWKTFGVYVINNVPMFKISSSEYLPITYTEYNKAITVNYEPGYGVNSYDSNGNSQKNSNYKFKTGTKWKWSGFKVINYKVYFQVSATEYLLSTYINGGGYKPKNSD